MEQKFPETISATPNGVSRVVKDFEVMVGIV
jgi:hypothetical protein